MITRYQSLTTTTLPDGRIVYTSLLPSSIDKSIQGIDIVTKHGDRLDLLAYKYYGKQSLWWAIAQANNIVEGTMHIAPGTTIHIPAL